MRALRFLLPLLTQAVYAAAPQAVFNESAGGLGLTVFADDSYAVWTLSAAAPWLRSAFTAGVRAGGQLYTYPAVPGAVGATRLGAAPAAGSHARLGPWRGWQVNYTTPRGGPFVNTFQLYPAPPPLPGGEWRGSSPLIVFEQSFPAGLQGVNGSSLPAVNGFAKSGSPSTLFPVFMDGNSSTSLLTDWLTWADTFFRAASGDHVPVAAGLAAVQGTEGGPLALSSYAQGDTIVLAPFTNLKSTILGKAGAPDPAIFGPVAACGVSSFVQALPPGHATACAIGYAPGGFNAGMHAWGATMLAAHGTQRLPDPASSSLTYWTVRESRNHFSLRTSPSPARAHTHTTPHNQTNRTTGLTMTGQCPRAACPVQRRAPRVPPFIHHQHHGHHQTRARRYAYEPNINSKGLVQDILVALSQSFKNGSYPGPPLPVSAVMLGAFFFFSLSLSCRTAWALRGFPALHATLHALPLSHLTPCPLSPRPRTSATTATPQRCVVDAECEAQRQLQAQ